jgi:AraC family transcriptional regulator
MQEHVLLTNGSEPMSCTDRWGSVSETLIQQGTAIMWDHDRRASKSTSASLEAPLGRLRAAVAEICVATNNADERESKICLQAAIVILRDAIKEVDCPIEKRSSAHRSGLALWQIRQVVTHIEANLQNAIWNKELAAVINLSPSHFSRAFKKSLADTPHRYVMRRRLERAKRLMLRTEASLAQIAAECGFADQPHFNRVFRKFVEDSPRRWRLSRWCQGLDEYQLTPHGPDLKRLERLRDAYAEGPRARGGDCLDQIGIFCLNG